MASALKRSDGPTPAADNETVQPSIKSASGNVTTSKMKDNSHSLMFERKLLTLFCLRGLGAGYKFELSKEKEVEGGTLDDVIFRYEVPDKTLEGKHWRYRYLQAKHKHKENEGEKITADHLLDYNPKGDFSLPKYFHSFYKIRARGDDIHDCIICTNIDFNSESLRKRGVELVSINDQPEDIFEFDSQEKTTRYKLKINDESWHKKVKEEWSPVQLLAKKLADYAITKNKTTDNQAGMLKSYHKKEAKELADCARTKNKTTNIQAGMLKSYHVALVDEHVIDCTKNKFHQDFVDGAANLSEGAKELRQKISELGKDGNWKDWKFELNNSFGKSKSAVKNPLPRKITKEDVDDFFDKLVFVVQMPNEKKFKEILETRDMSQYYGSDKCKDETIRMLHEIPDVFSNEKQNFWLDSKRAKDILLDGVTKMSSKYKDELEKEIKFNDSAIKRMANELKQKLLESSGRERVEWIFTHSPKHTAVKVISAVQILMQESNQEGNYLVTRSTSLQNEIEMWKNILKLQKGFYHYLVVVCDSEASTKYLENFISDYQVDDKNFIIIISRDGPFPGIRDEIEYTDLSKNFQEAILSKTVLFQGENLTVRNLVGEKPEEVIDFNLIEELLFGKTEIKIPSYYTSRFEESLYIKRRVWTPFDSHFEDEIAKLLNYSIAELRKESTISQDGHIQWLVKEERQKEIWEKLKIVVDKATPSSIIKDNHLISCKIKGRSIVIISGVAGTGKSTLLCHYYNRIKKKKSDDWIIKMNLVDRCEALMKWYANQTNAADFFVNYFHEIGHTGSFINSLLRHRLQTGDRITIMFDGFDEIDVRCQKCAIQLIKAINQNKSIQLYVTTRPHSASDLQFQLSQLAYTLESFNMKDQISYLTEYWKTNLQDSDIQNNSIIRNFAESLANRVSETLGDQERSFIGIPLQCRILAECFQHKLQSIIERNNGQDELVQTDFENVEFDLNSLYKRLMKTKRRVFREEKLKVSVPNQIIACAIDFFIKKIESHLTKLAIETLVTDKKSADILWPPQASYHQSETKKTQEEKTITECCIKFGLITCNKGDEATKTQFLHRTYAEYLLAKYLYKGIAVTRCENNQLLDNESVRDLIVSKILVEDNYDGVRTFFDSMLKAAIDSEKWQLVINKTVELPVRLQNFACSLDHQITRKVTELRESDVSLLSNPISLALQKSNVNLFETLFQCLDIKFEKSQMNGIVRSALDKPFSFEFFLNSGNAKLFRRIISYYDDASADQVQRIVKEILYGPMKKLFSLESYRTLWNNEQRKEVVKIALEVIYKHQTNLYRMWGSDANYFGKFHFSVVLLHFFIFNEDYDSLFEQFFRLLSSAYSNDRAFVNLLKFTLRSQDANNNNWAYPSNSGIKKTLTNLKFQPNRYKVIEGLSQLTLVWNKQVFEEFYKPFRPNNDEDYFELVRGESEMTCLHRAAFYGDEESVDNILETIRNHFPSDQHPEIIRLLVESVVRDERDELVVTDERFTPFYVAAACGHKKICHKILSFLKDIIEANNLQREGLVDCDGFLQRAMLDAILFKNLEMFELILEAVKEAWGQESLLDLLKTGNNRKQRHFNVSSSLAREFDKDLLKTKVKILLQNDREKGYKDLKDLVLTSNDGKEIGKTLQDMEDETLQGMLTVSGMENWTKRFFDLIGIDWAFHFLSRHLLAGFTRQQRSQFVDAITTPLTPIIPLKRAIEISYWAEWLVGEKFTDEDFNCLGNLLKLITENQDSQATDSQTTDIQKLLFNEKGKDITRALMCQDRNIVPIVGKHLSEINQLTINECIRKNGPEIIDELFQFDQPILKRQVFRHWMNILPFYDDGDEGNQQFKKLVETLLFLRTEKHKQIKVQYSFWSRYLDSCDDTDSNKIEMVDQFLKCVSDKLGKRALRKVVLHKDCMGIVLLGAELQVNKKLVNVMLTHLSDQDRDCVDLLISTNSPFNSRRYKSIQSVEPCQCKPMNSCCCWYL